MTIVRFVFLFLFILMGELPIINGILIETKMMEFSSVSTVALGNLETIKFNISIYLYVKKKKKPGAMRTKRV